MAPKDIALALLVAVVWGANFTVIKVGLAGVPPLLLAALRYVVVVLAALLFVPRPNAAARYVVAYGLSVGVGQFGALFYAMDLGLPAGVASVIMQSQAVFTLLFAALLLKERLGILQGAGMGLALAGLALIAAGSEGAGGLETPVQAFFLALFGAACWGISNVVVRLATRAAEAQGSRLSMVGLVVWSSLVPPLPLFLLSLLLDTPAEVARALTHLDGESVLAVLYIAFISTLFGFGAWSQLLGKYPAGLVAPFSLLVPVTGLIIAQLALGERLSLWQWFGCLCVVGGLLVSTLGAPGRPAWNFRHARDG